MKRPGLAACCLTLATLAGFGSAAPAAWADDWPSKPIRLIVPFPAGGPTDALARQVAARLGTRLGQNLVIENIGGANASIGTGQLVRAKPDGYTFVLGSNSSQVVNPLLYTRLGYDPARDTTAITLVAQYTNVLVVNQNLPVKTVPELIAYARAHPGEINYGSAGNGSSNHLGGFNFARLAGIGATHVPYKGSAPALIDLMSGNTTYMFDAMVTSMPQVQAGKLRALATGGATRSAQLPDLPTIAETLPGFESVGWFGLFGPAGLPEPITQRLSAEYARIASEPDFVETLSRQGLDVMASTPAALQARMARERLVVAPLIKASGAKVD